MKTLILSANDVATAATAAQIIKDNGIVGCGGAGFPTYAKLDTRAKTIIMNCAECEPLLKLHQQQLKENGKKKKLSLPQILMISLNTMLYQCFHIHPALAYT